MFAEWAVGGLTLTRMRTIAARVIAVDAMQRGADFMETYRLLREDLDFSIAGAFGLATRVHRSGGFAKDAIYLEGFRAVVITLPQAGRSCPLARQDRSDGRSGDRGTAPARPRSCADLPAVLPGPARRPGPDRETEVGHRPRHPTQYGARLMRIAFS